ncbi:hypothetical protein T492DRAFT_847566 [Pavlovales sp. CCMP2436]|nr:hypothetical protein T492DRAFT_847566 [Pavlovales sp. CCMP2436]
MFNPPSPLPPCVHRCVLLAALRHRGVFTRKLGKALCSLLAGLTPLLTPVSCTNVSTSACKALTPLAGLTPVRCSHSSTFASTFIFRDAVGQQARQGGGFFRTAAAVRETVSGWVGFATRSVQETVSSWVGVVIRTDAGAVSVWLRAIDAIREVAPPPFSGLTRSPGLSADTSAFWQSLEPAELVKPFAPQVHPHLAISGARRNSKKKWMLSAAALAEGMCASALAFASGLSFAEGALGAVGAVYAAPQRQLLRALLKAAAEAGKDGGEAAELL